MTDYGLQSVIKACPNLHHLELNRCELTDTAIKWLAKELPALKFVDLTSIPAVTLTLLEEIKQKKTGATASTVCKGKVRSEGQRPACAASRDRKREKKKEEEMTTQYMYARNTTKI